MNLRKQSNKTCFFFTNSNKNFLESLSENIVWIKNEVKKCEECNSITDMWKPKCSICENTNRNKELICVVEEYLDMLTIEESGTYDWVYHILWWSISPVNWVFIWDLNFKQLFEKIENADKNIEIILATNPNIEWEATSNYIIEEIENKKLKYKTKISKLSRWLSSWYIEYADNMTIINALKERKEI